ncbi:hypothetical protein [Sporocytophaga myxococcoides]|uniref:hypothetical protein n=1 Tax=Sporocytophaga myxococcoides TaxID=153721 RepID=UPI0004272EE4|nr:hypothetical protein [Sporocytophaga myxococcoides]
MNSILKILICLLPLLLTNPLKADQWEDPEWDEMIGESDLITIAEVTKEGAFGAKLKPITVR